MSTRSLTVLRNEEGKEIAVLYRHMDGYLSGHGKELVNFLRGFQITHGLINKDRSANGSECLAAQLIAHFKKGPGQFYLYPAGTRGLDAEYLYTIDIPASGDNIILQATHYNDFVLNKSVNEITDEDLKE